MVIDVAHFHSGLLSELDAIDLRAIYAFHLDDLEDCAKEAVTDAVRLLPGLGVAPLAALCARHQAIGYDGPCSIEIFRPDDWTWDPQELAIKARAAARQQLAPYFAVQ